MRQKYFYIENHLSIDIGYDHRAGPEATCHEIGEDGLHASAIRWGLVGRTALPKVETSGRWTPGGRMQSPGLDRLVHGWINYV